MPELEPITGHVFFEREGSLAILSDDIILGELESPDGESFGLTPSPKVQFWNLPIPYLLSDKLPNPERVEAAIQYFNKQTPVKFVPFGGEADAIIFVEADEHCRSYLGRTGGVQPIFLSPSCGTHEIIHELMHALGFVHEQSRTDRDNFIQVMWNNIDPQKRRQFQKVPESMMEAMSGSDFDFNSIMLYKPEIFAKNPALPTMKPRGENQIRPVQEGLSPGDLERLRRIY